MKIFNTTKDSNGNLAFNSIFQQTTGALTRKANKDESALTAYFDAFRADPNDAKNRFGEIFKHASEEARAFAEAGDLSTQSIGNFVKAEREAAKASTTFNNTLKNIGTSLLTIGANIGLSILVTQIGNWVVKQIDQEVNKIQYAKDAIAELSGEWEKTGKSTNEAKKLVDNYASSYEKLSKGVNVQTGENLSLSESEYNEWLAINAKIADSTLSTVEGVNVAYDAQGNAIVQLTGQIGSLEEAYASLESQTRQQILADADKVMKNIQTAGFEPERAWWDVFGIFKQLNDAKVETAGYDFLQKALNEVSNGATKEDIRQLIIETHKSGDFNSINAAKYIIDKTLTEEQRKEYKKDNGDDWRYIAAVIVGEAQKVAISTKNQGYSIDSLVQPAITIAKTALEEEFLADRRTNKTTGKVEGRYSFLSDNAIKALVGSLSNLPYKYFEGKNDVEVINAMIEFGKTFGDERTAKGINALVEAQSQFSKGEINYGELQSAATLDWGEAGKEFLGMLLQSLGLDSDGTYPKAVEHARAVISDETDAYIASLDRAHLDYIRTLKGQDGQTYTMAQVNDMYNQSLVQDVTSLEAVSNAYEGLIKQQDEAAKVIKNIGADTDITLDDYKSLIAANKEYADAVVNNAGTYTVDYDKIRAINQRQIAEAAQNVDIGWAQNLAQQKQLEAEILALQSQQGEEQERELKAKQEELKVLQQQAAQYKVIANEYKYMASSYKRWLDAKNVEEASAGFNEGKNALAALEAGQKSGRRNTEQYKAAYEYIFGERAFASDAEKTKAITDAQKLYNKDGYLDLAEWRRQSQTHGMQEADGKWTVGTIEEYAKGMGWSVEYTAQAIKALSEYEGYQGVHVSEELLSQANDLIPKTEVELNTSAIQENTDATNQLNETLSEKNETESKEEAASGSADSDSVAPQEEHGRFGAPEESGTNEDGEIVEVFVKAIVKEITPEEGVDLTVDGVEAQISAYTEADSEELKASIAALSPEGVTALVGFYDFMNGKEIDVSNISAENVKAYIGEYQKATGIDLSNIEPEVALAYIQAYAEIAGGAKTDKLKPSDIIAFVKAYAELNGKADTELLVPMVKAWISEYDASGATKADDPELIAKIVSMGIDPHLVLPEVRIKAAIASIDGTDGNGLLHIPAVVDTKTTEEALEMADVAMRTATEKLDPNKYIPSWYMGNVDLSNRRLITPEAMREAGWTEFDGDYATLYSQTMSAGNKDEGYDFAYGQNVVINATPILPDGTVLTPGAFEQYIEEVVAEATSSGKSIMEVDKAKKSLIESVDEVKGSLEEAYESASENASKLSKEQGRWDRVRYGADLPSGNAVEAGSIIDKLGSVAGELKSATSAKNNLLANPFGWNTNQIVANAQTMYDNTLPPNVIEAIKQYISLSVEARKGNVSITESDITNLEKINDVLAEAQRLGIDDGGLLTHITDELGKVGIQANDTNSAITQLVGSFRKTGSVKIDADVSSANKKVDNLTKKINTTSATLQVEAKVQDSSGSSSGSSTNTSSGNGWLSQLLSGSAHASGTNNAKGGLSLVGEAGREIWVDSKNGRWSLVDKPSLLDVNKGDIIFNNKQTEAMLKSRKSSSGRAFDDGKDATDMLANSIAKGAESGVKKGLGLAASIGQKAPSGNGTGASISNKTSSSGSSNGKGGSGNSSNSNSISSLLKELEKLYDWIPKLLENLKKHTTKLIEAVEDFVGYANQNRQLQFAIESVNDEIAKNYEAYERYFQQAKDVQSMLDISDDFAEKIREGAIDIEMLDDDTKKKVEAYKKWADAAQNCLDTIIELKEQEHELILQRMDNIINDYQNQLDIYADAEKHLQDQIKLQKQLGREVTENQYENLISNEQSQLDLLQDEFETLRAEFLDQVASGNIKAGTEEWHKYRNELDEINSAITDAKINISEFADEIYNLRNVRLQNVADTLQQIQMYTESTMSFHEAQGHKISIDYYQDLIANGHKQIDNLEEQNKLIRQQMLYIDKDSEKYQTYLQQLRENENSILGIKTSQEQWNDSIADSGIEVLKEQREELEKQNEAYEKQLNYAEALEALEKAKRQRNKLVYQEGVGFTYQYDQDAIDEAQRKVDELEKQMQIDAIDDEIDRIEKNKENDNVWDYAGRNLEKQNGWQMYDVNSLSEMLASNIDNGTFAGMHPLTQEYIRLEEALGNIGSKNVTIDIGDINLTGVDNTEMLAKDIVQNLPNYLMQELYHG